jgi:hypothetical protein
MSKKDHFYKSSYKPCIQVFYHKTYGGKQIDLCLEILYLLNLSYKNVGHFTQIKSIHTVPVGTVIFYARAKHMAEI